MFKLILFCFLFCSVPAFAVTPKLKFEYQELGGSYDKYKCSHQHKSKFEWLVSCPNENGVKNYRIHLSIRRYPKTVFGSSGYEVMYWITEINRFRRVLQHDSVTVWIHNSEDDNKLRALELRQGIENDLAQLNLYLSWKK